MEISRGRIKKTQEKEGMRGRGQEKRRWRMWWEMDVRQPDYKGLVIGKAGLRSR